MSDDYEDAPNLDLLPCPFCGERLVKLNDHHGSWYSHADYPTGSCEANVTQIMDERDAKRWNTRAPIQATTSTTARGK